MPRKPKHGVGRIESLGALDWKEKQAFGGGQGDVTLLPKFKGGKGRVDMVATFGRRRCFGRW